MRKIALCFWLFLALGFTNKVVAQWQGSGTQSSPWLIAHSGGLDYQAGNTVCAYVSTDGKTLNIYYTGSGESNMADFWNTGGTQGGEAPWHFTSALNTIETIVIEYGVANIGRKAFKDCSNLQTITIPSTVTKINAQAFLNCTHSNFLSITIPASVTEIEGEAFKNCAVKTVTIVEYGGNLTFKRPQISGTYYDNWFQNCQTQTLILKRQYTFEGSNPPFKGISALLNLTIGKDITTIGTYAFADCGLTNVTLEPGADPLKFDNDYFSHAETVFSGCPINTLFMGRKIINGYGGFTTSYKSPFYNKITLKTLTAENNIPITAYSFQNCINLETVNIGNEVTSIDGYAFDGCSSLSSVIIGNSVTSIGDATFRNCSALTNISIPDKVSSLTIGSSAFANSGLTSITVPDIVTSIGTYAFADCGALTNVTLIDRADPLKFDNDYFSHSETVFSGSPINTLYMGRIVTNGYGGFSTSYKSPFYNNTTLKTLTIGKDIASILNYTFQGCSYLTQITSNNPVPPTIGANTFDGVIPTTPVHVPCVLAYQSSSWGTKFSNFVQTGDCPNGPTLYTLNVLSSNTDKGHVTSISLSSGAVLTSTWGFEGNISTSTSTQFSGKAIILANAKYNSIFMGWEDEGKGNLEPMRIVDITSEKTYTALFAASVKIDETKATTSISVYPNPAKDKVMIELPENTVGTLALFDMNGKIIRRQSANGNINTIDIAFLSAGTYILHLVQDGVASGGVKIVKE